MDLHKRKKLYNSCKLNEPLTPADPRYVNFDEVMPEDRPRGEIWVERLARQVELADDATCLLFTGLPGSGKSTELRCLARRLQDAGEDRAHLFAALVDAEEFIDPANPIDIPDLLLGILYHVERRVLEAEGTDPQKAGKEGSITRIWNWLSQDVKLTGAKVSIPEVADLTFEMKARPSLREQIRNTVTAHLTHFVRMVHEEVKALHDRVCELGFRGLVIIVDSLEKLRGSSSNWDTVLDSAEKLFCGGAPYLYLPPAHVIYTVPAALFARGVRDIAFMPMIKVRDRDGRPFEPGIDAMLQLVWQRISGPDMKELLGETYKQRLKEAIQMSGGYPRELLRILRDMLMSGSTPVSDAELQRIYNRILDDYRALVEEGYFDWLARVAVTKHLTVENERHREQADRMLSANAVLRYINDRAWDELHPAVQKIPGVQDAIARLKQQNVPPSSDEEA